MNALDALARFSFFDSLSESAKEALRRESVLKMVAPNTPLLQKGDEAGGAFFVSYGVIRVFYIDKRGRQGTLYRVEPGQACFLSLECAMRESLYPAWAESEDEPTQFVRIPSKLFKTLYAQESGIQQFTYDSLASRVLQLMAVVEQSATLAVEQRTAGLLLNLADADDRVLASQARLAEHLGSAREVIARTMRTFRGYGLIETRRGVVQLLDVRRLRNLAGQGKFD